MEKYMKIALNEAYKAYKNNEIPVGAVIIHKNKIIAKAKNNRQKKHNVLGHAEINCIIKAEKRLKDWRLDECEMYVTLEPCEMCYQIIKESRIKKVKYLLSKNPTKNPTKNEYEKLKEKYLKIFNNFFEKLR